MNDKVNENNTHIAILLKKELWDSIRQLEPTDNAFDRLTYHKNHFHIYNEKIKKILLTFEVEFEDCGFGLMWICICFKNDVNEIISILNNADWIARVLD